MFHRLQDRIKTPSRQTSERLEFNREQLQYCTEWASRHMHRGIGEGAAEDTNNCKQNKEQALSPDSGHIVISVSARRHLGVPILSFFWGALLILHRALCT